MSTMYAKVVNDGERIESVPWKEWRNVGQDSTPFSALVLHRWIRDRGGLAEGERLRVTVCCYPANIERHENGEPMACVATVYNVSGEN